VGERSDGAVGAVYHDEGRCAVRELWTEVKRLTR
jgi:hypothetical protein